jgi:hypothetical protein
MNIVIVLFISVSVAAALRRGSAGKHWRRAILQNRGGGGSSYEMNPPPPPPTTAPPKELSEEDARKIEREFKKKYDKIYAGFDLRPAAAAATDDIIINYREDFEKKDLLDKLENPKVSLLEKMRAISAANHILDIRGSAAADFWH